MVAGGGGGGAYGMAGRSAGGLNGYEAYYGGIATQTSGYAFGKGASAIFVNKNVDVAGGGGGYYGGYAKSSGQASVYNAAGGGGSSYISGHVGSIAIKSQDNISPRKDSNDEVCEDGTTDIECSKHYSGFVFDDTVMVDGDGYNWTTEKETQTGMPKTSGEGLENGHSGDGFAKITYELLSDNNYHDINGHINGK